ncbi:hypothetical protein CDAR_236441 [Caerostris darwini]|uniref:Uncharacterized protein n=1 Tax=Caerostris darwini TaxID=1538125 RepID=A0AAV4TE94_9ARAC|nr:hypothetical protein CDAR_236441 [Caerostris darwini]
MFSFDTSFIKSSSLFCPDFIWISSYKDTNPAFDTKIISLFCTSFPPSSSQKTPMTTKDGQPRRHGIPQPSFAYLTKKTISGKRGGPHLKVDRTLAKGRRLGDIKLPEIPIRTYRGRKIFLAGNIVEQKGSM